MNERGSVRAFLALELPEEIRESLVQRRNRIRTEMPKARWTRPEAWHLTLKFLGDVDRGLLDGLTEELGPSLCGHGPVFVRIGGAGFFPTKSRPRVAWLGGTADGVDGVVAAVENAAAAIGIRRERRPWSLHLTLARLRQSWPRSSVEEFIEWGEAIDPPPFTCTEVVLFESDLQPGGAVYTALERYPLT